MHISVMPQECLEALNVQPNHWYLDATFGRGGHTRRILEQGGNVIAFDLDQDAIAYGQAEFAQEIESKRLVLVHNNFSNISRELYGQGRETQFLSGALFDLGMSSNQIDESGRGFTFQKNEPLDMRMSDELGVTAADLLNALPEKHLKNVFWEYAQEIAASAIARAIVERRKKKKFETTRDLAELVVKVKRGRQGSKLHPATKVFQALRIAVNMELDNLKAALDQVLAWLAPNGRLAIMSFHEGEDRIVKHTFIAWEESQKGIQITKKPLEPTETEVKANPRSRSAKLRIFENNGKTV